MASKYYEFGYYDKNGEIQVVKYKRPLRIRIVSWLSSKLFNYTMRAELRYRRRRYARHMRKKVL